jgi:hypothetical protein
MWDKYKREKKYKSVPGHELKVVFDNNQFNISALLSGTSLIPLRYELYPQSTKSGADHERGI